MTFYDDPLVILLIGCVLGGAFSLGVAKANINRGVQIRQSIRLASIVTAASALLTYLIVLILRWIL